MEAVEKQEQRRSVCTPVRSKKASKYSSDFLMTGAQKDNGAALRTATTSCILDVRKQLWTPLEAGQYTSTGQRDGRWTSTVTLMGANLERLICTMTCPRSGW